jgi:acyl carrier protein
MKKTRDEIKQDTLMLLRQLADDWEYSGVIAEDTRMIADMGFESLDVVVLSAQVQEHYGQILPFTDLFEEIGKRELKDICVGEWVDFVDRHINPLPVEASSERAGT